MYKSNLDNVLNHFTYEAITNEKTFRNIMDTMFKMGFHNVAHEVQTKNGRIDTLITEKSRIFIIEYKCYETASIALKQINEKEYNAQYLHTNVPIVLLGINLGKRKENNNRYIDIACDIKNDDK